MLLCCVCGALTGLNVTVLCMWCLNRTQCYCAVYVVPVMAPHTHEAVADLPKYLLSGWWNSPVQLLPSC